MVKVNNENELNVAQTAIEVLRQKENELKKIEVFLESKKFKLHDYVVKKGSTYFDNVFNTGEGMIGKIVGWDFEGEYYRVHFNNQMNFTGVREDFLEFHEGDVPEYLNEVRGDLVKYISFYF